MKTFSLYSIFLIMASVFTLGATPVYASENLCQAQLPFGRMPVYTNKSMMEDTQTLCFQEFAVFYSGKTRTPLLVSEHLHPKRLELASQTKRQGEFYEEKSLGDKASLLTDYRYSGYDRGHMAPSADMSSVATQQQSFSLSNIVPQVGEQNSGPWLRVEKEVRNIARKEPIFVMTGVLFEGSPILFLQGRVAIPTSMYKVIYNPRTNEASAYLVDNKEDAEIVILDIVTLQQRAQVNFGLPNPSRLHLNSL